MRSLRFMTHTVHFFIFQILVTLRILPAPRTKANILFDNGYVFLIFSRVK